MVHETLTYGEFQETSFKIEFSNEHDILETAVEIPTKEDANKVTHIIDSYNSICEYYCG